MIEPIVTTWSGGKDSALALYYLLTPQGDKFRLSRQADQLSYKNPLYRITSLLTTVTRDYNRISMHGVRNELLDRQAESLGLPLEKVFISKNSSNEDYERQMKEKLLQFKSQGVNAVAFGDLFLEDIRKYREENLTKVSMKAIFPLWGKNTKDLALQFIDLGFKAVIVCVDSEKLDKTFAGRLYDQQFLSDLPPTVDPCGENGEFHTFVFDGPIFKHPIPFKTGETVLRDNRFYFCDLVT